MARYVPLLSPEQAAECARLYTAGAAISMLRAVFKCSSTAIRTALRHQGVKTRPKGGSKRRNPIKPRRPMGRPPGLNAEQAAEAEDLYLTDKWPRTRIARYFKVSNTSVDTALASRGVVLRSRGESAIGRRRTPLVASVFDLGRHAQKDIHHDHQQESCAA